MHHHPRSLDGRLPARRRYSDVHLALDLLADAQAMYHAGSEAVRTIMNRTIFRKLFVANDGDTIVGYELNAPFDLLTDAYSTWQGYPPTPLPSLENPPAPVQHPHNAVAPHPKTGTALLMTTGSVVKISCSQNAPTMQKRPVGDDHQQAV